MDVSEVEMERDALESELDAALRKIVELLHGRTSMDDAAWWLCANHPKFLLNYNWTPVMRGDAFQKIIAAATRAGAPPKQHDWQEWFARVEATR